MRIEFGSQLHNQATTWDDITATLAATKIWHEFTSA